MTQGQPNAEQRFLTLLREICSPLPATEEYVMVHHPAFRVGKKPFLIAGMERAEKGLSLSVNLGPELQHQLLNDARFSKTPYIGRHGWVTIAYGDLKQAELVALIRESFLRVANAKQRAQLAAETARSAPQPQKPAASRVKKARPSGR